jgi:hypothetical protein
MLMAIYLYVKKPVEVTIIGGVDSGIAKWLNRHFLPDGINAIITSDEIRSLQEYPYFRGRAGDGDEETAFVCRNFTCSLPIKSQDELAKQLGVTLTPS